MDLLLFPTAHKFCFFFLKPVLLRLSRNIFGFEAGRLTWVFKDIGFQPKLSEKWSDCKTYDYTVIVITAVIL